MNLRNIKLALGAIAVVGTGALITNQVFAKNDPQTVAQAELPPQAGGQLKPVDLPPQAGGQLKPSDQTIVDLVLAPDGEFDVLQAAVISAGLVDALSGDNQLTVFAPTDQAFIDLFDTENEADPEAAAIAAVESLPVEDLTEILLYHVTEGRRNSKSVLSAPQYEMLNGMKLSQEDLTAAGISATDISASNGLVHVIDKVLMP